jgi:3-methyladenine DNA glycosylase AlkD
MQELKEIQQLLKVNAKPAALAAHKKFVPGAAQILGVRMPVLNLLAAQFKSGGVKLVQELWNCGSLEEKMLAAKMLGKVAKQDPELAIKLVKLFSKEIENWVVCDTLGMQSLKPVVNTHATAIFELASSLNKASNLWQRRLSLVLVEWYTRDASKHPQINLLIKALEKDKEYYVKKAVIWIKRNMYKGK